MERNLGQGECGGRLTPQMRSGVAGRPGHLIQTRSNFAEDVALPTATNLFEAFLLDNRRSVIRTKMGLLRPDALPRGAQGGNRTHDLRLTKALPQIQMGAVAYSETPATGPMADIFQVVTPALKSGPTGA